MLDKKLGQILGLILMGAVATVAGWRLAGESTSFWSGWEGGVLAFCVVGLLLDIRTELRRLDRDD